MNILLIDDDRAVQESLCVFISNLGHSVSCASHGREGMDLFEKNSFQLVFTDVRMPVMDGFEVLKEIKKSKKSFVDVVIITGHGDMTSAITALREGAYDYLQKPVNIEEVAIVIDRVCEHLSLKKTTEELTTRFEETVRERVSETETKLETIRKAYRENIGFKNISIHSKKIGDIIALAKKFHKTHTVPILIEGETGTGKEVIAQYIHHGNDLSPKPFITINCGAIPADLFESELIGHEAGTFTGSGTAVKKGKLELAEDGTILLDEIGDMPLSMQVKLLRVLEEREFYRVGGVKRILFQARVIAATNKNLEEETRKGTFRSDLFHRLNVGYIEVPPLRERVEEIVPLAYDFLERASARHGKRGFKGMTPDAEAFLERLPWEGNIRQLENAIERMVLLYDGLFIEREHLLFLAKQTPAEVSGGSRRVLLSPDTEYTISHNGIDLDDLVNKLVEEALRMSDNNKTLAAKLLNISPRTISRRLEKLGD